MIFTKNRPQTHQKQTRLSTEEAYRLWEQTSIRYTMINHINLLSNYTHDLDLQLFLKNINEIYQNQARILEKKLKKYMIKSPEPNRRDINTIVNAEVVQDKETARVIYSLMQLAVTKCFLAIRDSILNDDIRELIIKLTIEDINLFCDYIEFMLLKGWLEEPPLYKSLKNAEERVATNEIWHLWEVLENRYLSIQQTKFFISSVLDKDFEILLKVGIDILEKQSNQLEELLLFYEINLPDRFPKNIPTPESNERFSDQYIFNVLFWAMKNATTLHGFSVEELVINSKIRNLFKTYLFEEMELINNLIKYGKIKGWVPMVPQFRSS